MAYNTKVGSFNIDTALTAGQTQAISGVGFLPKIVVFWFSGTNRSSDGVGAGNLCFGMGAMNNAGTRFVVCGIDKDDNATSLGQRVNWQDTCIVFYPGDDPSEGKADFSSMDSDGFTLTIDEQFTSAMRVSYLALGGDDLTNFTIGQGTQPTSTGNYSISGLGFQPDAVLFFFPRQNSLGNSTTLVVSFGVATGASNQGVVGMFAHASFGTSLTKGYGYNGEVNAGVAFNAVGDRDAFVSMDSDGFTLNHLENTTAWNFNYIALKGGQYKVGELTTRTDGNDIVETEPGFEPEAILFLSACRALSTQDTQTDHLIASIGAATSPTERAVHGAWDETGLTDTEIANANYDSAVYAHVRDDAIAALMDLKSIDPTGFTCVMDDTEPTAGSWVTYLAIGAAEVAAAATRKFQRASVVGV